MRRMSPKMFIKPIDSVEMYIYRSYSKFPYVPQVQKVVSNLLWGK